MAGTSEHKVCKVLVIGVGSIGERHVRCFLKTGRTAVSICEVIPEIRDKVSRRYEIERVFAVVDAALAEPHDAAVVAVPANFHVPIALKAIQTGLDVLIEKPLSVSLDNIDELVQIARSKGCAAAVGYVYRAHPALAAMRQAIIGGRFGKPLQLVAVAGQHFPTYRPAYRTSYYTQLATGGGVIQDALTHVLNAGEWLLGPIDLLVADSEHKILEDVRVDDVAHILARHGDVLASYSMNQFQSPNELTITIVCERGTARFEYHQHRWRWMLEPDTPWHDEPVMNLERDTIFVNQANSFLDAVAGNSEPLCNLEAGVRTLRVNLAALKSVENRAWESIRG
jgi:predicted dehydrogenase